MIHFLSANNLPISVKAQLSGRSRSSFYYKHKQPEKDGLLLELIKEVHEENPYYGYKRIACSLGINHKCVYRIMKKFGIRSKYKKKRHSRNQYTKPKSERPNLMKDMKPNFPDSIWAGDFTEFKFARKIYYFATIIDIYTREIIGWHIATNHSVELVAEALKMAVIKRSKVPLIFHSDHGSEYISDAYLKKLKEHGIKPSNSGKGKPWQNGIQESFYNRFKREFGDPRRFERVDQFVEALSRQVNLYNTKRIHSAIKMPPSTFYAQAMQQKKTANSRLKNTSKRVTKCV